MKLQTNINTNLVNNKLVSSRENTSNNYSVPAFKSKSQDKFERKSLGDSHLENKETKNDFVAVDRKVLQRLIAGFMTLLAVTGCAENTPVRTNVNTNYNGNSPTTIVQEGGPINGITFPEWSQKIKQCAGIASMNIGEPLSSQNYGNVLMTEMKTNICPELVPQRQMTKNEEAAMLQSMARGVQEANGQNGSSENVPSPQPVYQAPATEMSPYGNPLMQQANQMQQRTNALVDDVNRASQNLAQDRQKQIESMTPEQQTNAYSNNIEVQQCFANGQQLHPDNASLASAEGYNCVTQKRQNGTIRPE